MAFPKDYAVADNVQVVCDGDGHNSDCYLRLIDTGNSGTIQLDSSIIGGVDEYKIEFYVNIPSNINLSNIISVNIGQAEVYIGGSDPYSLNVYDGTNDYGCDGSINSNSWTKITVEVFKENGGTFVSASIEDNKPTIVSVDLTSYDWKIEINANIRIDDLSFYKKIQ